MEVVCLAQNVIVTTTTTEGNLTITNNIIMFSIYLIWQILYRRIYETINIRMSYNCSAATYVYCFRKRNAGKWYLFFGINNCYVEQSIKISDLLSLING